MMDMHIHVRNILNNPNEIEDYINKFKKYNITELCFLEHGERISNKHKGYLVDKEGANQLKKMVDITNKKYKEMVILTGIEIDYSNNMEFRERTLQNIADNNFEVVIGSVHNFDEKDDKEYFWAVCDLLKNYPINILGHLKLKNNWLLHLDSIEDIIILCKKKNIAIEINTSDRSIWNDEQHFYMMSLIDKYNIKYTIGSDAHKLDDIGKNYNLLFKRFENRGAK